MPFYVPKATGSTAPACCDMKAGLVTVLAALRALHAINAKPGKRITILVNTAEETGQGIAADLIRKLARRASLVLCLEPALPGGALKIERKGRLVVRMDVKGRSAHGGTPEKGTSAIEELAAQIARFKRLRVRETTVNVGLIGGEKANVVAESAWATLDIRFWKAADRDRVLKILREAVPGPSRGPDQGHGRGHDAAHGEDQGFREALPPGPGDRGPDGPGPEGRPDRGRIGRLHRLGAGGPDARRPRPRRGRPPRRA
ncbi:MAG: M20/M25/M40 family metallo-hydrolase [Candidatus Moduliflexus flocculans]|nr:M20/M25/M40 family metallo-hydrolase [Candidatus Moduliflexus flocculans]